MDEGALVLVALIWGSTFVVVGGLVTSVPPAQVLLVRFSIASLLLVGLSWRGAAGGKTLVSRGGAILGLWLAAGFGLQTVALVYTTPARAAFITGFCVVLPSVIGALLARRLPRRKVLLAAALAGAGVGLIGWPGTGQAVNPGDALCALCALAYGVHIHLTGHYAPAIRASLLTAQQMLVSTAVFALATLAAVAALHVWPASQAPSWAAALAGRPWSWTPATTAGLLYLTLFATVLAYYLMTRSQQRVSPTRAGLLFALEPVFAAALSIALHRDDFSARLAAGGMMVVAGILLSNE